MGDNGERLTTRRLTATTLSLAALTVAALVMSGCSAAGANDPATMPPAASDETTGNGSAPDGSATGDSGSTPGAGKAGSREPAFPVPVADTVAAGKTADFGTGVKARLVKAATGKLDGQGPGAVAGPSYIATVEILNNSDQPIVLDTVSRSKPMTGMLQPGKAAQGTYVFALPDTASDAVQVAVGYVGDVPIVVFTDTVPR